MFYRILFILLAGLMIQGLVNSNSLHAQTPLVADEIENEHRFFLTMIVRDWGEIYLDNESVEGWRFKDKIVYKAIYEFIPTLIDAEKNYYEDRPYLAEIHVLASEPGPREIIFVDELELIRARYIFKLGKNGTYNTLDREELYSNGALESRTYYDFAKRVSKVETYIQDSKFQGLDSIVSYKYDATYGGVIKETHNPKGVLLEYSISDSNGNLIRNEVYSFDPKTGDRLAEIYNNKGLKIALQRFEAKTDQIVKTTYFDTEGQTNGYRLFEYTPRGTKSRVLTFSADGGRLEILHYDYYGDLKKREIMKDGKVINSLEY